ncbi:hypothetical protein [Saccharopolyspora griseoalba]|uniref:Uncharacterized protein n=1 Tax=Saccharopolyspora griseoalba TaxID=1431848 RepID=A0ABW2LBX2_9PSEU
MTSSSDEHRAEAEEYLNKAKGAESFDGSVQRDLLIAQVHATLALAPEPGFHTRGWLRHTEE